MKIGLVRHFKVNHPFPTKTWVSKAEVAKWFAEYDRAENIQYKPVHLEGIKWERCFSSTMLRAVNTAAHIYGGEIVRIPELQELDIVHRLPDKIKLPFFMWGLIARAKSMSSNEDTDKFRDRIRAFAGELIANSKDDVLVVSHWFVMRELRRELIEKGFVGDDIRSNEYGVLYVYEKAST